MERIVAANVGFDFAATEAFGRDEVTPLSTCGPALNVPSDHWGLSRFRRAFRSALLAGCPAASVHRIITMKAEALRALQAPFKTKYKNDPASAMQTLTAQGMLDGEDVVCSVRSPLGKMEAGLHPFTGGDGSKACSAEVLLQALIGCAGVTLKAVATAMDIPVRGGTVRAEGDMDFRGTLGVSKETPVGFQAIRLTFDLDSDATPEQMETLVKLTKRYCVVYQTLANPPALTETIKRR
jgi:uncharacterized OsmC-like protein